MTARLLVAAPQSGSGKTTIVAGLIVALRRRGLAVQPFKCGPDYIDPGYHSLVAGTPCRNLDTWLLGEAQVRSLFQSAAQGAGIALVEGVMGLYDGAGALDDAGSSADVARVLDAPVVLVVDARGMARSAAALVAGFLQFDPRVRLVGVLLNRVGSARHAELCASAIRAHTGLPCLGYLERRAELVLPERHLGLVTTAEEGPWAAVLEQVADALEQSCDLDALLALARAAPPLEAPAEPAGAWARGHQSHPVIALARDAAFSFAYPELAELLGAAGARVAWFSPLEDRELPPHTQGLILSGGFPEIYARQLSANLPMLAAVRAAHAAGMPIYAECGGLMYLTEQLETSDDVWPMAGLLPGKSVMTDRVVVGYRSVTALRDGPLLPAGAQLRGHEFHYSRWLGRPDDLPHVYAAQTAAGQALPPEGAQLGSLLASYVHLLWQARPEMALRFVQLCRG